MNRSDPAAAEIAKKKRGKAFIIGFVVVLLAVVGASLTTNLMRQASNGPAPKPAPMPSLTLIFERLEIVSYGKSHRFSVEVMRNDAQRARGLMFRQTLPQENGMLFDFERDQIVTMWMKNTPLPLDMLFVTADGRIHRIESRTEPFSERMISSGAPVRAVLEINAGISERLGLKPGDQLKHPMFK
jgi:uncharacterized protein